MTARCRRRAPALPRLPPRAARLAPALPLQLLQSRRRPLHGPPVPWMAAAAAMRRRCCCWAAQEPAWQQLLRRKRPTHQAMCGSRHSSSSLDRYRLQVGWGQGLWRAAAVTSRATVCARAANALRLAKTCSRPPPVPACSANTRAKVHSADTRARAFGGCKVGCHLGAAHAASGDVRLLAMALCLSIGRIAHLRGGHRRCQPFVYSATAPAACDPHPLA